MCPLVRFWATGYVRSSSKKWGNFLISWATIIFWMCIPKVCSCRAYCRISTTLKYTFAAITLKQIAKTLRQILRQAWDSGKQGMTFVGRFWIRSKVDYFHKVRHFCKTTFTTNPNWLYGPPIWHVIILATYKSGIHYKHTHFCVCSTLIDEHINLPPSERKRRFAD
jgi:hypothetical protein